MSESGGLLLRAGLVSQVELVEAEKIRAHYGGTLGEALVAVGALDEQALVDFFTRRLLVPRLEPERFAAVTDDVVALLTPDLAAEFRVFPVDVDEGGAITLAMADPADAAASDEVAFFTGRFVARAVAEPSLIRAAIQHYYGLRITAAEALAEAVRAVENGVATDVWHRDPYAAQHADHEDVQARIQAAAWPEELGDAAYEPPPEEPSTDEMDAAAEPQVDEEPTPLIAASRPGRIDETLPLRGSTPPPPTPPASPASTDEPVVLLTRVKRTPTEESEVPPPVREAHETLPFAGAPLDRATPPEPIIPLTRPIARERSDRPTLTGLPMLTVPDPPVARLRNAQSRDEVAELLLDYLGAIAPRAAMFVIRRGILVGYGGRGAQLDLGALQRIQINVEVPSIFRDVIGTRMPYRGPLPETPANRVFLRVVGELRGDALVIPVAVGDRVVVVLYADGIVSPLPDAALHAVAREAGRAYERLIRETSRR